MTTLRARRRSPDFAGPWQLSPDARLQQTDDGTTTVTRRGLGVALDADGSRVAAWLATPQSLPDLLQRAAQDQPPLPPLAVVRTLVRLEAAEVLADGRAGWVVALPGTGWIGPLLRQIPPAIWLRGAQLPSLCALVWLLVWLGLPRLLPPPFGLDGAAVALLVGGLLAVALLWRALTRGLVAQAVGLPGAAQSLRLRWRSGAEVAAEAMTAVERKRAQVVAWTGLGALGLLLLAAVAATALSPQPLWRVAVWICALALLVDLTPELPTDARTLISLATTTPALGTRARAWLVRRALSNFWQRKPMSQAEERYVWAATLSALHLLLAWLVTTRRLLPWALALLNGGIQHGNALWAALPFALAVLWLAVLLAGMAGVVWDLLRQARPPWASKGAPLGADNHRALVAQAAKNVAFLRALGDQVLDALPAQMTREAWQSGATILRQGDPGDRLCCLVQGHAIVEWEDLAGVRHLLARLGPGDFFGESAVLEDMPRSAHVVADGPVQLYALSREAARALVERSGTSAAEIRRQLRHTAALREHPLFAGLSALDLSEIVGQTRPETHGTGEAILRTGDAGQDLFVVLSGTCGVWQHDKQTGMLGPQDWFGELALLTGAPRNATVRAETPVELLRVPAAVTQQALARDPLAALRLWQVAAERLQAQRSEP